MQNATLYSHQLAFDKIVQLVKTQLPKVKVITNENGLHQSLTATIKGGFFSKTKKLTINYRQRQTLDYQLTKVECDLTQNLAGMVNFIQSLPAENEAIRAKLLYKVMATNSEWGVVAEPNITTEFEQLLKAMAQQLNAFLFVNPGTPFTRSSTQHFLDKHFQLILDMQGSCEVADLDVKVDAKYHDIPAAKQSAEQLERKAASEAHLHENGVKVNKNLPVSPTAADVKLRSQPEVTERVYALMIIAVKGEGIPQSHLEKAIAEKQITSFSPQEQYLYQKAQFNEQEKANATWRYESLATLLWALGQLDSIPYPSAICDVKTVVGMLMQPSREVFTASAKLRSTAEILDELDKVYRMHWACVDARLKGEMSTGQLNASVIYERHYALNWLTNYREQEWDSVSTDT
ncbi:MAG: DUF4272 domain-containing protein [Saprospiraceae bacterium]